MVSIETKEIEAFNMENFIPILPYSKERLSIGVKEKNLSNKIKHWLNKNNILHWNTTATMYGTKGIADLHIGINSHIVALELKGSSGSLSANQKRIREWFKVNKIPYLVISPKNIDKLNELVKDLWEGKEGVIEKWL